MAVLPHPLSEHFNWTPCAPPFRSMSDEQAADFDELGFFVVPDALDPTTVSELLAQIDPIEHELEALLRQAEGGKVFIARADEITFTTHVVTRSERLNRFVAGSPMVEICADLLGPDVRLYWDQAVYKKPDTAASFPWHQDNGYAFLQPQQYVTCWIALTDATLDNGCPWVVPGIHRMGTLRHHLTETGLVCLDEPIGAVPVPVQAGGMVVFSSLTPHCTGPNRTDRVRKAYIVQYAPDGACVLSRDSAGVLQRTPADAPDRQFPVLVGGEPVAA
jgi:ectoine hydroxylase-related dioxygenase (phytanoyl-CoA dioxygenase family)